MIELGQVGADPNVRTVESPAAARTYAMSVVLPTGEVALFGGAGTAVEFSDITAIFATGSFLLSPTITQNACVLTGCCHTYSLDSLRNRLRPN